MASSSRDANKSTALVVKNALAKVDDNFNKMTTCLLCRRRKPLEAFVQVCQVKPDRAKSTTDMEVPPCVACRQCATNDKHVGKKADLAGNKWCKCCPLTLARYVEIYRELGEEMPRALCKREFVAAHHFQPPGCLKDVQLLERHWGHAKECVVAGLQSQERACVKLAHRVETLQREGESAPTPEERERLRQAIVEEAQREVAEEDAQEAVDDATGQEAAMQESGEGHLVEEESNSTGSSEDTDEGSDGLRSMAAADEAPKAAPKRRRPRDRTPAFLPKGAWKKKVGGPAAAPVVEPKMDDTSDADAVSVAASEYVAPHGQKRAFKQWLRTNKVNDKDKGSKEYKECVERFISNSELQSAEKASQKHVEKEALREKRKLESELRAVRKDLKAAEVEVDDLTEIMNELAKVCLALGVDKWHINEVIQRRMSAERLLELRAEAAAPE